jgi:signal transduction histidine kinase
MYNNLSTLKIEHKHILIKLISGIVTDYTITGEYYLYENIINIFPINNNFIITKYIGISKEEYIINLYHELLHMSSTIIDETKRLRFQVEKVLQLSMYDQQKANLKMKEVNANELITSVVKTFALKVEKNSGKIITDLKAENPMVLVDDMHFTNVVFNLLDNAVKYRRADSNLELKITTWNESDKLCISIQDNGIGIKKDDLKKIFDKFFRVHTGNVHDVKGFGLGLAYVKKIINDHRGSINVDSEIGIGTKFIIKVPVC